MMSKSSVYPVLYFLGWKVSCITCSLSIFKKKKRPQEQMEQSEATNAPVGCNQRWFRCCSLAPVAAWCNKHFPLHPKPQSLYISTSSFRQLGFGRCFIIQSSGWPEQHHEHHLCRVLRRGRGGAGGGAGAAVSR